MQGVRDVVTRSPINLPGCPAHPDWIVGTIAQLLAGNSLDLDRSRRPKMFYGSKIHTSCPMRGAAKAARPGVEGCQGSVGCRGPETYSDCGQRLWNGGGSLNGGGSWCVGVNAPCNGCTAVSFPDGSSPFYA